MNNSIITTREEIDNLVKNIVYLRKNNNLSKKSMAEKLGVSLYSLNIIEKGQIPKLLTVDMLLNIEKEFGIMPSQLFTDLENK